MHGFFVLLAVGATLAGCGGPTPPQVVPGQPHGSEAMPGATPVVGAGARPPENCNDFEAAVKTASAGGDGEEISGAIFAQAECERARLAAVEIDAASQADYDARLERVAALYAQVVGAGMEKWSIGAWVRTGTAFDRGATAATKAGVGGPVPGWRNKAREAYEAGLAVAEGVSKDVRFDVEVADWIKAGCTGLGAAAHKRFKVCRAWKDSWR